MSCSKTRRTLTYCLVLGIEEPSHAGNAFQQLEEATRSSEMCMCHGSNRPCGVKVSVYLWMMEAVRPGNDIYSDTWAKAILSRDSMSQ